MILQFNTQKDDLNYPLCFRFFTNSSEFTINYEMSNIPSGNFPHLGITARQGVLILYKKDALWFNVDTYTRIPKKTVNMNRMINDGEEYEVLIYGPILSNFDTFSIEVPDSRFIKPIKKNSEKRILVVGGVHSFGIGCTTTGVMFSNILSRKLDLEVNHLAFNNRNYLKEIYFYLKHNKLEQYEYIILELDYFNQDDNVVQEHLLNIINILKNHCKLLIGWSAISSNKNFKKDNLNKLLEDEINNNNVIICDCSDIYDDVKKDMCVSSDYFINDTGNIFIYKKLVKLIRSFEKWNI